MLLYFLRPYFWRISCGDFCNAVWFQSRWDLDNTELLIPVLASNISLIPSRVPCIWDFSCCVFKSLMAKYASHFLQVSFPLYCFWYVPLPFDCNVLPWGLVICLPPLLPGKSTHPFCFWDSSSRVFHSSPSLVTFLMTLISLFMIPLLTCIDSAAILLVSQSSLPATTGADMVTQKMEMATPILWGPL